MMTKKTMPLSETEKALFKKIFRNRIWIAFIFGVPLISGIGFMTYMFVDEQIDIFTGKRNDYDWGFEGYLFFFFLVFMHLGLWFYFVPLYKKTLKNRLQTHKIVVTTTILNIDKRVRTKGVAYSIQNDYKNIDTFFQVFLTPISFEELQKGMIIEIHHLEHNFTDITKIVIIK